MTLTAYSHQIAFQTLDAKQNPKNKNDRILHFIFTKRTLGSLPCFTAQHPLSFGIEDNSDLNSVYSEEH